MNDPTETPEQILFDLFKQFNINYTNHSHKPIFTVDEGLYLQELIPGAHSKNLFLRNKKKTYYCLISVIETKTIDLKQLSDTIGHGRLSFGSSEDMFTKLNLTPGSVSPYGLINDKEHCLDFLLDQDFLNYNQVNFHPLRNDMTVSVGTNDFLRFLKNIDYKYSTIEIPVKSN